MNTRLSSHEVLPCSGGNSRKSPGPSFLQLNSFIRFKKAIQNFPYFCQFQAYAANYALAVPSTSKNR